MIKRLRELDCCALESTELPRPHPAEAKPRLELELGDVRCGIELWDRFGFETELRLAHLVQVSLNSRATSKSPWKWPPANSNKPNEQPAGIRRAKEH